MFKGDPNYSESFLFQNKSIETPMSHPYLVRNRGSEVSNKLSAEMILTRRSKFFSFFLIGIGFEIRMHKSKLTYIRELAER